MKSSADPLFYRQPTYMNCPPFLKENLEPPFYDFSNISTTPINKVFHTMAPQSNFALTSFIIIQLS